MGFVVEPVEAGTSTSCQAARQPGYDQAGWTAPWSGAEVLCERQVQKGRPWPEMTTNRQPLMICRLVSASRCMHRPLPDTSARRRARIINSTVQCNGESQGWENTLDLEVSYKGVEHRQLSQRTERSRDGVHSAKTCGLCNALIARYVTRVLHP